MNRITTSIISICLLLIFVSGRKQTTIFVIGDSTAANKTNPNSNPERGWGMALQGCFDESIVVDNHALNGRSSKSFIDEGRWQKVLDLIKPGDYVLIQFGHNDEKPNSDRHTDPGTTFDANLARFVNETRAKGGNPVLLNAVVRRNFYRNSNISVDDESLRKTIYGGEKVNSDTLVDTHGAYLESPRIVARKMNVPFVDANKVTHDLEQSMGVLGSRQLHMWITPGANPSIPKGRQDDTHYNFYGAHIVANLLADAIAAEVPELRKHLHHYDYIVSENGFGNYLDLQQAINDIQTANKTQVLILDGNWKQPNITKDKNIELVKFPGVKIGAK